VKWRIWTSTAFVTGIALLVLGIPLAVAVRAAYSDEATLRLEREASEARQHVNPADLGSTNSAALSNRDRVSIGLYDLRGRKVVGFGPLRADAIVRRAVAGEIQDGHIASQLVVAVPLAGSGKVVGVLRASEPEDVINDKTDNTWLAMSALAVGALGIAALLAWWQSRRLGQPIVRLVASADRLGAGDFSIRTEQSGIAELDEIANALDRTAHRLDQLVARERTFSADVSHQLRTPIAGLRVRIESALFAGSDSTAALEELLAPLDRLEATVEDLLALARDTHSDRAPLDIDELFAEISLLWREPLAATGRHLEVLTDRNLPKPVVADQAVRQILEVLLSNAQQHGRGRITLQARRVRESLVVEVRDEGRTPLDVTTIFTRRVGEQHGIGLALARSLAEAEGARLELEGASGQLQTTFKLILPGR
jgi:signal transduction histidine kinase